MAHAKFFEKGNRDRRKRKRNQSKPFERKAKARLTKAQRAAMARSEYERHHGTNHHYRPNNPAPPVILGHHNPNNPPFTPFTPPPTTTPTPHTLNDTLPLTPITLDELFRYIDDRKPDRENLQNFSLLPWFYILVLQYILVK